MRNRYALQSVIAAAGLFAALPAAWAAPTDPGTPVHGQVTAVDTTAKTITLEDRRSQSTSTLKVNDATKYLVDATGAISDIKVGQTVRVMGQADGTTLTARMIQVVPPEEASQPAPQFGGRGGGGGRFNMVQGVVATLTPTLTITTTDKQTDTVQTDTTTRVTTSHAGTLADVKPDENVNAITTGTGDAAVATSVHVRQAGGFGGRGGRRRGGDNGAAPAQ